MKPTYVGMHIVHGTYLTLLVMKGNEKVYYSKIDMSQATVRVVDGSMTVSVKDVNQCVLPIQADEQVFLTDNTDWAFMMPIQNNQYSVFSNANNNEVNTFPSEYGVHRLTIEKL